MSFHEGTPLLRSNFLFPGDTHQQEQMLSFSSPKSEVSFLSKDGGQLGSSQNSGFPYYQRPPLAYSRNGVSGYGSANMHVPINGARGPFTPSQWAELEHQALIHKYICANVPVPTNLLVPLKKTMNPYGFSGSSVTLPPNSFGWGSFHLGFAENTDPEPGRCRRTDGKKWRCARDAVVDQKYCERHINRGRHRSRKPVEGQTSGQAAAGNTNSKVVPKKTAAVSTSVVLPGGSSNSLATQHQHHPPSTATLLNNNRHYMNKGNVSSRMPEARGLSMMSSPSSTMNLKANEPTFNLLKQELPLKEPSLSDFGFVSTDSLLNPSHESSYLNSKSYTSSFLDFSDQATQDEHPLRQFIDEWPKHQSNSSVTWPEEMKPDWTQLSMSIPVTSTELSSSSSSPKQEKLAMSPLRLSREFEPTMMNLGPNNELGEAANQKQINWGTKTWGNSMGGPLGEVLISSTGSVANACSYPSALNLLNERWEGSPHMGSSPTGVLQKSSFCSLSNSSTSGSSPRAEHKMNIDGVSVYDDVMASSLASSSVPSL
ncbi:hypothetical protein UlMin_038993 [Ulmus minor]